MSVDQLIITVVAGIAVAAAIVLLRPRPDLVIRVRNGKPMVKKGKVSRRFLGECEQLCGDLKIQSARIWGQTVAGRTSLRFSAHIAREHQQKFRNVWSLYH